MDMSPVVVPLPSAPLSPSSLALGLSASHTLPRSLALALLVSLAPHNLSEMSHEAEQNIRVTAEQGQQPARHQRVISRKMHRSGPVMHQVLSSTYLSHNPLL